LFCDGDGELKFAASSLYILERFVAHASACSGELQFAALDFGHLMIGLRIPR